MRRTFRSDVERCTWWLEVEGASLRIGRESDDPTEEPFARTRKLASEAAARAESEVLVREQLAEGFVEVGAALPAPVLRETADAFFDRLLVAWRERAPEVDAARWRAAVAALAPAWRERLHDELVRVSAQPSLPWPERREREMWLRMQAAQSPDAFLLALRHPRAWRFALEVLEGTSSPSGYAPAPRAHDLERALVSMVQALPPIAFAGEQPGPALTRTLAHHPFGAESIARWVALAASSDPVQASNAALVLARYPSLTRADVLDALAAWNARTDLDDVTIAGSALDHAVAELGASLTGSTRRPRTRAELGDLLGRARARC